MELILPPKEKRSLLKTLRNIIIGLAIILLYIWIFSGIDINWSRALSDKTLENTGKIIPQFFKPDATYGRKVISYMLETLFIAYAGSLIAAILAVPFAFFAATNIMNNRLLSTAGKWVLNAIRTFPEILLALVFVVAIGPGPFAGVMAIGLHSIGMLGKLYTEAIESIDMNVVQAMEANGANKIQILFYAIIPQVIPEFLSYAIYRFEINVRASTILGLIGAGGIGTLIIIASTNRNWDQIGMILIVIILVVTIIDYLSTAIRKKIV